MIDLELIGGERAHALGLTPASIEMMCALVLASAGLDDGHLAIEFVDEQRIEELNREHRGRAEPTDVLSFGIDEDGISAGPRELGDVVICPALAQDLGETVVHGLLHLTGMDHETDEGEMLALQAELMSWMRQDGTPVQAS